MEQTRRRIGTWPRATAALPLVLAFSVSAVRPAMASDGDLEREQLAAFVRQIELADRLANHLADQAASTASPDRTRYHFDYARLRADLALALRAAAFHGLAEGVCNHFSVELPDLSGRFLLNPRGLLWEEVQADDIVLIDGEGNILAGRHAVEPTAMFIHAAIHRIAGKACVLHTHTRAGVAVSAQAHGVLPISQQSTFVLASLAYHGYEGVAIRDDEKLRLQADLGEANYLMLRNHGLLTVGKTIADAFLSMYTFENTCRIQVDALAGQNGMESSRLSHCSRQVAPAKRASSGRA